MKIILTEDVQNLGKRGALVRVADGYARNYLIPKGWGVLATAANLKMVEEQRIASAKKEAKLKEEAEILAGELNLLHLVLSRKAGDTGVLFGSVTSKDLAELLEANGIHLDRRRIPLEHPIKKIGNFNVDTHPHTEITASLMVSVVPEESEPVAKVLKRGAESDKIIAEVEARLEKLAEERAAEILDAATELPEAQEAD